MTNDGFIYLAGPYTHELAEVRDRRFEILTAVAARLMHDGNVVYSPITHGHTITGRHFLPLEWEFWKKQSLVMLDGAASLVVLKIEGWTDSVGVGAEIRHALERKIPIRFVDTDGVFGQ